MVLEMFLYRTRYGQKTFGISEEFARSTWALAANQGLYNGFLAAGLVWGLVQGVAAGRPTLTFFLACVAVAGVYGAATVNKRILFAQTVPGAAALVLVWLA
jgi:putative membrane protein